MEKNDEKKEIVAEKEDKNQTEKVDEQAAIKRKIKRNTTIFKNKMIEKLNNENIDNVNLKQLQEMAEEVCDSMDKEKSNTETKGKTNTNTKINRTKLMTDYNLIRTFILYLFIKDRFVDGLQYLTTRKKKIKEVVLKAPTDLVNQPIIEYFKPYFEDNTRLIENDPQMPKIIKCVFENFCIDMYRPDNIYDEIYRIDPTLLPEDKQKQARENIEKIIKSREMTMKLQEEGVFQKGTNKRYKHTEEMEEAIKSGDPDKINKLRERYNKNQIIFSTKISTQKNNEEQIYTESNDDYINMEMNIEESKEIEKQKNNIENNVKTKGAIFNITKDRNLKIKSQLNKKRGPIQDIEKQQNKIKKKFKHIDKDKKLKKPELYGQIDEKVGGRALTQIYPAQEELSRSSVNFFRNFMPHQPANRLNANNNNNIAFTPLLNNNNNINNNNINNSHSAFTPLNPQSGNLNPRLGNLNPRWGNLNFIQPQAQPIANNAQQITNNMINLSSNSAFKRFGK